MTPYETYWRNYSVWHKKRVTELDAQHGGPMWRRVVTLPDGSWGLNPDCPIVQQFYEDCKNWHNSCKT